MPDHPFRILIVEDDPVQSRLATAILQATGFKSIEVVGTAADGIARAPAADIVLLDIQLPDGSGLDVLRLLRERSSRPAVVIITGHGAEKTAVDALRLGADDYVSKDAGFIDLLPGVVERIRRVTALRDALEIAESEVVEAERRSAVGEMTVALHHELNNPLMAALTEVALLREEPGITEPLLKGLGVIQSSLERIKDAVKRAGEADGLKRTPYVAGSVQMIDLNAPPPEAGLRGRALVVAEDDQLRRVMSVLLRRVGFDIESFARAEEGGERLTKAPLPSAVVLGGVSTSGREQGGVFHDIPGRPWTLVVVALPGSAGALGQSCDLLLKIPFDPATFGRQIADAVDRKQGRGPALPQTIG